MSVPLPFTARSLKPLLLEGRVRRLIWLSLGVPALAEIAARSQPDALVLDLQHGLWERNALEAAVGLAGAHVPVIARTADFTPLSISTALDAGVSAVMAPLVETESDARALVQAGHYPPLGRRSGGGVRPLLAGGMQGMLDLGRGVALGAMIETALGVQNAEAICAVPGLDFIFIGTGDLALSMPGASVAEFEACCARLRDIARHHGLPCGLFTHDAATARQALADGYAMAVAANDIGLAMHGFQRALEDSRDAAPLPLTKAPQP